MTNLILDFYKGKTVWVIGRSFGLAAEMVKALSVTGANLIISAKSVNVLEALQDNIFQKLEKKITIIPFDITNEEDFVNARTHIEVEMGDIIDIVIFCPNSYFHLDIEDFSLKDAKEIINVNVIGFLNFVKTVMPFIKSGQIKQIVILNSILGYLATSDTFVYGASKAAVQHMAENLYYKLRKYDVTLNLINPGFINSKLIDTSAFNCSLNGVIEIEEVCERIIKIIMTQKKQSFEIYFPKSFCFMIRCLSVLPFFIRRRIVRWMEKSNQKKDEFGQKDM